MKDDTVIRKEFPRIAWYMRTVVGRSGIVEDGAMTRAARWLWWLPFAVLIVMAVVGRKLA
jgi:hypothetical protein